ncbi:expressed unknown protein [Seminavis robusta]|uniref:Uncharacterized protein n=1 Tax=Seminavis robusta TaxID=568900 RepID=A0A9N8HTK0_9STRA|nr:expressed unknown protein [Seminavis robusta]|eukprot:Sro1521_g279520.2  (501) ;mRNA; r:26178-27680
MVEAVCSMDPTAATEPCGTGRRMTTTLHRACDGASIPIIVESIYRKHPPALLAVDGKGKLPLEYMLPRKRESALNNTRKLSSLSRLLGICPDAVMQENRNGLDLLQVAFSITDISPEALELISSRYNDNCSNKKRNFLIPGILTPSAADNVLCRVLGKLGHLSFSPGQPSFTSSESLRKFLGAMAENESIHQLSALLLHRDFLATDPEVVPKLEQIFQKNTALRSASMTCLQYTRNPEAGNEKVLPRLLSSLKCNQALQELKLDSFRLPAPDANTVIQPSLEKEETSSTIKRSALRKLVLKDCIEPTITCGDTLVGLLPLFSSLRELKISFKLWSFNTANLPDFTNAIVQAMRHCPLEDFAVCNALVDATPICEALCSNSTLKKFVVLRQSPDVFKPYVDDIFDTVEKLKALLEVVRVGNTTLTDILYLPGKNGYTRPIIQRIMYFLKLNKCGRQLVRQPGFSKESLVQLLEVTSLNARVKHRVQYGLLREVPSVWATCG